MVTSLHLLDPSDEPHYEEFVRSLPTSLLYASLGYRNFLRKVLPDSQDRYLIAKEGPALVGALPAFLKMNRAYGNILNSLPFFGSNGGLLVSPSHPQKEAIQEHLIAGFHDLAKDHAVLSSTLISNPLAPDPDFYRRAFHPTAQDHRIGQITVLNKASKNPESLMSLFHSKTRNCIRKAQKSGLEISDSGSPETLKTLFELHVENMDAMDAPPKPWDVFQAIHDTFSYGRDYKIYTARKEGKTIAALLVFFYNQTAEYFIPASRAEFRVLQPMSLLIFTAMRETIGRDMTYWNWGGTWMNQEGVYHFKARWGTTDFPYTYYVREYDSERKLRDLTPEKLLQTYPFFYAIPFSALNENTHSAIAQVHDKKST